MRSFMIFDFGSTSKCFPARSTDKWLVSGMNDFMHLQIVLRAKFFVAYFALVFLNSGMCANVLREILIAEK